MGFFDTSQQTADGIMHPAATRLPPRPHGPAQHGGVVAPHGIIDSAAHSISDWLGHGADASHPVTAAGARKHAAASQPKSATGQVGQEIGDYFRAIHEEGLSALLDPEGAIDRQQAQRDLASRFQVKPDGYKGPRRDNQISKKEYEQIAHTFSDIRLGRGDLHIDASAFDNKRDRAQYQQGALDDIANMLMTHSGRQQIENLHNNVARDDNGNARGVLGGPAELFGVPLQPELHRESTIKPLFGVPRMAADGNQQVDQWGSPIWDDPGAGHHDASALRTDNAFADPVHQDDRDQRNADGSRGEGTDVNIMWNPGKIAGLRSDVVLDHEMQHTLHETQGTMARGTLGGTGPDRSVNNWERQAVGLKRSDTPTGGRNPGDPVGSPENTYRAERNALGLGERWLPRASYSTLPTQAKNNKQFKAAWARLKTSGNVPANGA